MHTHRYGAAKSQVGDLYVPAPRSGPVVCLLHGGFWRIPYGREELGPVAHDLVSRGFTVWNLEYRRLGEAGGGWPGTFQDVAAGIDHLATLDAEGVDLDLNRVVVVGHSAGGHLALWSGARQPDGPGEGFLPRARRVQPVAVAGLAAILDLARTFSLNAGNGAVAELLGGSPDRYPHRYAATSPSAMLPLGVNQLILHGARDEALPMEMARDYVGAARAAGDSVHFVELPATGHMDYLDPSSEAHATLCQWLIRTTVNWMDPR